MGHVVAQSLSVLHEEAHFFAGGAAAGCDGGGRVVAGWVGSAAFVSSGTSSEDAHAATTRTVEIARADRVRVVYFTGRHSKELPRTWKVPVTSQSLRR